MFARQILVYLVNALGDGVVVNIKATDWETAKGVWSHTFLRYRPGKDLLWVDWQKRTIDIEKDYYPLKK